MNRYVGAGLAAVALCSASALADPVLQTGWQPRDIPYPGAMELHVDATDVERGIFRISQSIPVSRAGRLTLLFPKWVNGHHAATGPVHKMAGLAVSGGGRMLPWRRDPVDMHAFHVDVPPGVGALDVGFQYLSETDPDAAGPVGVVTTPEMLNLQWFSVALYPAGFYARQIAVRPSVTVPSGWEITTQLAVKARAGSTVRFADTDFEYLIDSPVMAGRYFRRFELGSIHGAPVVLDAVADAPEFLDAEPRAIEAHRRLVEQTAKVFGPAPFERYTFMVALSSELGEVGTEHLASSENRRAPDYLSEWRGGTLLPHELVHSWNGKARRPAELWTPDFNQPLRNSMLWLYEGQAQFWAYVLAARSGMLPREQVMDLFARLAAQHMLQPGRSWRTLADTGNDLIITRYVLREPWRSWRRSNRDSYTEGDLLWVKVDGLIRELSGGRRSMDDFARAFFQGGGRRASLYDFDDVVLALNRVQTHDWRTFLKLHVESTAPMAPSDWLDRSGYQLIFTDTPTREFAESEQRGNRVELTHSLGLGLRGGDSGAITEVIWDSPAFRAGLVPGSTIASVNGRKYSPELLKAAIRDNTGGGRPIELEVRNRNRARTITIDYRGGLRFPRLQRINGVPDRLGALLKPRAT